MRTMRMTSKRQVTLPSQVCEDLGVGAGDTLVLERGKSGGEEAWLIRPVRKRRRECWYGALHDYAAGKAHDMASVRDSIGKASRKVLK